MSLNCLTCQSLPRTDSDDDLKQRQVQGKDKKPFFKSALGVVDRTWSGNLATMPGDKGRSGGRSGGFVVTSLLPTRKVENVTVSSQLHARKAHRHHRFHSSGAVELDSCTPKLIRSSGMRRDWSFEDLVQTIKG